jgi:hypothetical protein
MGRIDDAKYVPGKFLPISYSLITVTIAFNYLENARSPVVNQHSPDGGMWRALGRHSTRDVKPNSARGKLVIPRAFGSKLV